MQNELSLKDLMPQTATAVQETVTPIGGMVQKQFNIDSMPEREVEKDEETFVNKSIDEALKLIEEETDQSVEIMAELLHEQEARRLGMEEPDLVEEEEPIKEVVVNTEFTGISQTEFNDTDELDEEFADEEAVESDEADGEEEFNKLRDAVKARIKPVTSKLDLSTFTINAKPSSIVKLFTGEKDNAIANWGLRHSGIPVHLKAFDGEEVSDIINPSETKTPLNSQKDIYKLIYDHEIAKDKPSFKEWLELINLEDEDDLYMGIYMAAFSNANTLHRVCPECNDFFMYDFTFEQMVEYTDDESKDKMHSIMNTSLEAAKNKKQDVELVPITDDIAIGLKYATLASAIFDNLTLSESFREKYGKKLSMLAYIDCFYKIDQVNHTLDPIEFKIYEGDPEKTMKYKVKIFCDIMKKLNVSQFYLLNTLIRELSNKETIKLRYRIPDCTCNKCGKTISGEYVTAKQLLFTRHQLEVIANM